MPKNRMKAYLFCVNCEKETQHEIEYLNGQIDRITCETCHIQVQLNQEFVNAHYKEEFVKRVLSKPSRMTKEMEHDLSGFLKSLPQRVISKPYRVYKEYSHRTKD
ncbi:bh protein [Eubacteriaceae bacterium ES3]|nr:bh protein [Eubacteriaceae bacterium ES3]